MLPVAADRLRHFTDREAQITAFDSLWSSNSHWVIVYTGLSGQGKSTLVDWLITYKCQPQNIRVVKIDLFDGLNPITTLDSLAELLPPPMPPSTTALSAMLRPAAAPLYPTQPQCSAA
jgi:hypothetical protein